MIVCFRSPIRVNPHCGVGSDCWLSDQSTGVGRVAFLEVCVVWVGDCWLSDQSTGVGRVAFLEVCDGSRIWLVFTISAGPF